MKDREQLGPEVQEMGFGKPPVELHGRAKDHGNISTPRKVKGSFIASVSGRQTGRNPLRRKRR